MMSRAFKGAFVLLMLFSVMLPGCGKGGSSPTAPAPSANPAPGPTPAPAPTPRPTPDPQAGLPDGPVVRFTIKLRTIDTGNFSYRDPFEDAEGAWIVHPTEFVVFDSTQKNAAGELCKWRNPPEWLITDPDGVFSRRGSSQPFLLRVDIAKRGTVRLRATIDGVTSNELVIKSTR